MRYVLLACLLLCTTLCGCQGWWNYQEESVLNNGGRGINLMPTDREVRAGER